MKPIRVQRKRTKGWKMPSNTVSVTRPGKWGNPFKVGDTIRDPITGEIKRYLETVEDVIAWYRNYLMYRQIDVSELKGKNLACFCKVGEPCHADVLLELANPARQVIKPRFQSASNHNLSLARNL